jgi:2-polyprenyl-3-methyl-5-hydroxy-6-metoxy-1,4-benzoquinol methylase
MNTEAIHNPLRDYRRYVIDAWAAHIAVSVGLFEALATPHKISELAAHHSWSESALRPLVRALVACGHLEESDAEVYSLSERSKALFLPTSAEYIGHALSFMRTTPAYLSYPSILKGNAAVGLDESQWSYVTRGSAIYAAAGIRTLLARLPALWTRRPLRILDVGCGQGAYLALLARALPHALLLGIDPTPRVVEDARARLTREATARVEIRHAHLGDVAGTFDVILINQIFHVTGVEVAAQMLQQARVLLAPGGHVLVQEILDDGADPSPALFGLNMRLLFDQGCALTSDELVQLIQEAGFGNVEVHPIEGPTPGLAYVSAHE